MLEIGLKKERILDRLTVAQHVQQNTNIFFCSLFTFFI